MFERFTRETRQLVMRAVDEATALQHSRAGTGHVLIAMIADVGGPTTAVLGQTASSLDEARTVLRDVSGPSASGFDDLGGNLMAGNSRIADDGVEAAIGVEIAAAETDLFHL